MNLSIDIAGLRVVMDLPPGPVADLLQSRYADFLTDGARGQAALRIEVRVIEGAQFIPFEPGPWVIETSMEAERVSFRSYQERGWADLERGRGYLEIAPEADPENYLRVLYAWLALKNDGLLLHAAGVIRGGRAFVFFGPSGAGKSTVARLSLMHIVLSDDLVLVRRTEDGFHAFGVPFRGQFPEAPRTRTDARLHGLYWLVQDDEHRAARLPATEGIARLAGCVPFLMKTPAASLQVLDRCAEIASESPVQALHFRKDAGFWGELNHAED